MRTCAYITILGLLATVLLSGCSEKEEQSDIDQNDIAKTDIDQSNIEQSDIDRLQGTWERIYSEQMIKLKPGFKKQNIVIKGDILTFRRGDELISNGRITLDPSKNPKTLDYELTEDAHGHKKGEVSPGIYIVEGDTFKWCNAAPGADDRPEKFSNNVEKNHMLIVFKREQK